MRVEGERISEDTQAEKQGTTNLPMLLLGRGFANGWYGLPVNYVQARLFRTKCIDLKGADEANPADAKELLDELPAENA